MKNYKIEITAKERDELLCLIIEQKKREETAIEKIKEKGLEEWQDPKNRTKEEWINYYIKNYNILEKLEAKIHNIAIDPKDIDFLKKEELKPEIAIL